MKTKLSVLLLNAFLIISSLGGTKAQVTIGHSEAPETHAILQVKDQTAATVGGVTAKNGGMILPRVELENKYQLVPFYQGDTTDTNYKTVTKPAHTGLIVYNLKESDEDELCLGFNQWDGGQWNCFQEKMGNAIATLGSCDSLQFEGLYQNDVALNAGNYMTIPLHVTKAGAYTITSVPDPDNGYYFTTTGVFMATGYYFISIPGAGTPVNHTENKPNGDLMKITFNGKVMDSCDPKYIDVIDSSKKPIYTMSCSSVKVVGIYKVDTELIDGSNYIEVTLDVDASGLGATYLIETNTVDGIYFKGQGLLNSTSQTVKLQGYGTPNNVDNKVMTITSNSVKTTATCKATVVVVIPRKKYASIGGWNVGSPYGYTLGPNDSPIAQMFKAQGNYGTLENSTVKFEGVNNSDFIFLSPSSGNTSEGISGMTDQDTEDLLLVTKPDIVFLGYYNSTGWTTRKYAAFKKYLDQGGVIIANLQLASSAEGFIKNVFGLPDVTASQRGGYIYQMSGTDEIMNGPFGNVSGKYWGTDAADISVLNNLPQDQFIVYTNGSRTDTGAGTNPTYGQASFFRHRTLNFIFNGEGAIYAAVYPYNTSNTISPFKLDDTTKAPIDKSSYGNPASYSVSNSQVYANILAWAIKQAEFNGINTPK